MTRLASLLLGATLAIVAAASPALAAGQFPSRIALPNGFAPEGITAGRGTTVYVGSLVDGRIWRGDVRTGRGSILVPPAGGTAVGTEYEARANRLWVAGGGTGAVRVYNATTGALLQTYQFGAGRFLNDLVATREAVYVTDSLMQQLVVIPLGPTGALPAPTAAHTIPLSGDIQYVAGFNVNGIVASRGWLIIVQSNTGQLFRVDPATGSAQEIDLGGASASFGDGLELVGSTLYAVRNQLNRVAVFRLGAGLVSAQLLGEITSADLNVPTTAAFSAGRLWAVNARFGTTPTPTTPYWITPLPNKP
jgi:strictosidine synthase-like protein